MKKWFQYVSEPNIAEFEKEIRCVGNTYVTISNKNKGRDKCILVNKFYTVLYGTGFIFTLVKLPASKKIK